MGKDTSNQKNQNSRNNKPYDASNSFVRKVASRVSGLFGGLFSTPDPVDEERPEGSTDTPSVDFADSEVPSLTRVGTLDYASPVSTLNSNQSKNCHEKINSPEPIPGPSRLQPRYERNDSFKYGCDVGNNVTPSGLNLHKFSTLDKTTDSPLPSYSGFHMNFSKYESPILKDESTRSARPSTFVPKHKVDLDDGRGRATTPSSHKVPRLHETKGSCAGDDHSESSESTSGCSSLVPQADRLSQSAFVPRRKSLALDDKLNYARQLKQSRNSAYLNRSIPIFETGTQPRPTRTPSFDVSAYGKPILNKSVRETMLSSPFYTGQTTYGGAAAARRNSLGTPSSTRNQIAVKPAAQPQEGINMSNTARRILAALEEFSTPLNDVKRIPTPAPPLAVKRRNLEPPSLERSKRPALTVPTVADMLKMRILEQIQDSTTMARRTATTAREPSPTRRSGKIVTKMKNRDKPQDDPAPPPPDLPKLSLEFSSLPKFDLPCISSVQNLVTPTKAPTPPPPFTFSSPSVPTTVVTPPPPSSTPPTFNFSAPTPVNEWLSPRKPSKASVLSSDTGNKLEEKYNDSKNNGATVPATKSVQNNLEASTSNLSSTAETNSLVNSHSFGFGDKFKPSTGSWTCDTCMLVNKCQDADKCIACETKRVDKPTKRSDALYNTLDISKSAASKDVTTKQDTSSALLLGFGDKFKPSTGSWTCDTCMLVNKCQDADKCIACETKRVDKSAAKKDVAHKEDKPSAPLKPLLGFGDKFKPDPGSWSCDDCMVRNKADCVKCVSCSANKPGSAAQEAGKSNSGSWKCVICLISNDNNLTRCSSCETTRPNGPLTNEPKCTFNFGLSSGFKFGIDKAGVDNKPTSNGPVSSKLVQPTHVPVSSGTFTFGVPKESAATVTNTVEPIKAVPSPSINDTEKSTSTSSISAPPSSVSNFTFGIPKTEPFTSTAQGFGLNGPLSGTTATRKSEDPTFSLPAKVASTATSDVNNVEAVEPVKKVETAPASFKFGSDGGKSLEGLFMFGAKNNAESKLFSSQDNVKVNFGSLPSSTTTPAAFDLKNDGPAAQPFGSIATPANLNFGESTTKSFSTPNATFGSTAATSNAVFTFGTAAAATPTFGAPSATPSFGETKQTNAFGTSGVVAPSFGSTSQVASPVFGSASSGTPAFPATAPSLSSGFNAPSFTFGSTPSTVPATFGSTAPPTFGTPAAPSPMFGGASTPSFGLSSSAPFGATSTASPSPSPFGASSQLSFGQTSAPPAFPSATPFQFGSSNPNAAPTLSLAVPSSFNFTGGQTPTFSAGSRSVGPEPRRKIIKAMRRTQK